MKLKYVTFFVLTLLLSITIHAQGSNLNILVFSKTAGFRHKSIPTGIKFMAELAKKNHWKVSFSEDSNDFTIANLSRFDVLVFLNTTGDILNKNQQEALKKYLASGKGFVGIHAATDTEMKWPWYSEMIGAVFKDHPKVQQATLTINKSDGHPAVAHLKNVEVFKDEWYNFRNPVAKHVNVLASLDESSYEGKRMNTKNHPIMWYHYYGGGRVFYTGLGHTKQTYSDARFKNIMKGAILWTSGLKAIKKPPSKKWTNLLTDGPYKNWDVFMGAPHATVKGLAHVNPKSNGKNAAPLGLNNDPKQVFSFEKIAGESVLHISGEIYGALTSKKVYGNYHLKLQFKWRKNKWEPRLSKNRDSGILYHSYGPNTAFWNVWMSSQEFQVAEDHVGDYYALAGTLADIPSEKKAGAKEFKYVKGGALNPFSSLQRLPPNHCNNGFNNEKPHGEWNTLELICFGGTSLHIVNGKVVMALYNSSYQNLAKAILPLTQGRIQIQSEGAEVYYKNIAIKSIDKIPSKFKKQIK